MTPAPIEAKYEGIGICDGYRNDKWVVCIKNWKPNNDINGLEHLEIHHTTDEQFILLSGKCVLITAERKDDRFQMRLTRLEVGTLYTVPAECWFFTIVQRNTKMMYVQDSSCSTENSEYCKLTQQEIAFIQKYAGPMLAE